MFFLAVTILKGTTNFIVTPPMKSVRKRRFRKTKKKKYMDAPELERELKRLLRADLEATSVRWEVRIVFGEGFLLVFVKFSSIRRMI